MQQLADRVTKAAGIKCPRVTIEKIEERSARKSQWSQALAAALGVEHDWLLSGDGPKKAAPSIDKRLKLLTPDIAETLHSQFDALIDLELEKRQRRDQ